MQHTPGGAGWHPVRMPEEEVGGTRAAGSDHDLPHWWRPVHAKLHHNRASSIATKVIVAVVGTAVVTVGIITLVTPGPAFIIIPAGLAILATEFKWARRWLVAAKDWALKQKRRAEEMDPAVRRRRLLLTVAACLLAAGLVAGAVWMWGWPGFALSLWDRAQNIAGFLPELPGS